MAEIEAVVLTGGASTRMGVDKAMLDLNGEPLGRVVARRLVEAGYPVTVCGREPIDSFRFRPDTERYGGPLAALAAFEPSAPFVFVTACDVPRFQPRLPSVLRRVIGSGQAAVPLVGGHLQPTAALYASDAFPIARRLLEGGSRSLMAWLDALDVRHVDEIELLSTAIDGTALLGANSPEEFSEATHDPGDGLTDYLDALRTVLDAAPAATEETVPIDRLYDRVLAEPVVATADHPTCDCSAVDGFAICESDRIGTEAGPVRLSVAARLFAGHDTAAGPLTPGDAAQVTTGAPLPVGTSAVVMRERVERQPGVIRILGHVAPDSHIRRRAEEFRAGDLVVPAGVVAYSGVVAAAAMTGRERWRVAVPPTVAVVVTGDELTRIGSPRTPTGVFDTHTPTLTAALAGLGIIPVSVVRCADRAADTEAAIAAALGRATLVLTTGGVGGGERDFVRMAFAACGVEEQFAGVRMKPGRPVVFGRIPGRPVYAFGLPGNPGAALVAFEMLVKPFILKVSGHVEPAPKFYPAVLTEGLDARPFHTEFVPVALRPEGERLLATPLPGRRSHMFGGLAVATGLAMLRESRRAGSILPVAPWGGGR